MSPHTHVEQSFWEFPISLTVVLFLVAILYLRGWSSLRSKSAKPFAGSRPTSFFIGVLLIWTAWGSPLAGYDHILLTFHMIKHLFVMTFAPPFLFLGEPLKMLWHVIPHRARSILDQAYRQPFIHRATRIVTRLGVCLVVSSLALVVWHLPALFALCIRSMAWHVVEQATFFGAGLLFWWPVIQPWPSAETGPRWSILLYLFLATLPCDILSGFLVFSDRIAYPAYFFAPRMFGLSVLEDQQCAGALMWTCVTIVYLVPAAIVSTKLLAPRTLSAGVSASDQRSLEAL